MWAGTQRILAVRDIARNRRDVIMQVLALRVERAIAWRKQLGITGVDQAYRLLHGAGDGVPGFTCDVLGKVAVIWVLGEGLRPLGRQRGHSNRIGVTRA